MVLARDKELADLKEMMKQFEQVFYMGFTDAENSCGLVIFKALRLGSAEGWMAVIDALNLPATFPFRDLA